MQVLTSLYSQLAVKETCLFFTGDVNEAAFLCESEKSVLETMKLVVFVLMMHAFRAEPIMKHFKFSLEHARKLYYNRNTLIYKDYS